MENLNSHQLPMKFHRITYSLNVSGHYIKEPLKISFGKLPEWLKVEVTQTAAPKSNGAETIIHGPTKNGKCLFYTGLRETGLTNWQYGNHAEFRNGHKSKSLVLFRWSDNDKILTVYFFTGWYYNGRERLETIIQSIINNLNNESEL